MNFDPGNFALDSCSINACLAASTHYWISPADKLVVVTLEQIMHCEWDTERGVKITIYDAIQK